MQLGVSTVDSELIEVRVRNPSSSPALDIVIDVPDTQTLRLVRLDAHHEEYFAPYRASDSLRVTPRQDLHATMTYRDKFGYKYRHVLRLAQRPRDDGAFNIVASGPAETENPAIGFGRVVGRTLQATVSRVLMPLRRGYSSRREPIEQARSATPFSQTFVGGVAITVIGGLIVVIVSSWLSRGERTTADRSLDVGPPSQEKAAPAPQSINPQPPRSSSRSDPCIAGERVYVKESDSAEACLGIIVISVVNAHFTTSESGLPSIVTAVIGGSGLPDVKMQDARVGSVVNVGTDFQVRLVAADFFSASFLVRRTNEPDR